MPPNPITSAELEGLFEEHREGLAGAIRGVLGSRADVQELIQEAFLRTWRAQLRGAAPDNRVAWIFVVTLNLAKDSRRKRQRRGPAAPLEEIDPMQLETRERGPGRTLDDSEAMEAARAAIRQLDDKKKEVFLLRVSAGLSFDAISEALSIPTGTAKTRMRAALIELRQRLAPFSPGTPSMREL